MGGMIRRRLERLEERMRLASRYDGASGPPSAASPEDAKERWLAHAKARRAIESRKGDGWLEEFHAHDVFRLLRSQGNLPGTAEELHVRLLGWRPPIDPHAVDRVLAWAIYEGEEGTEGMECPAAWREAFGAAEELRRRYMDAPAEELAEMFVAAHRLELGAAEEEEGGGGDRASLEELAEILAAARKRLGIPEELVRDAVGPDGDEVGEEERRRRLREILGDFYYGEKGYEVQRHITRLVNEREERGA